CQQYNRAPFTF
nr:immunoglobulin light chain junction region [Macaca mulatta]